MADRTVKVKLVADVSDYTAGLVRAAAATRGLAGDVEKNVDRDLSPAMRRAGERQGGLLAQGVRTGLMRNSPLIAAAIGGALLAGAPVALAGAGVLFAGIGAVSAAQSSTMRDDWTGLGHEIRDGAVRDAAVLGDSFMRAADQIRASFQRMRPELQDAFEASAPQIERFTEGLTAAAENAMPGLLRAVERGGPVIDGLADLMGDLGTGLSDFFDAMSSHSPAAGNALDSLGDAMENLLPLLGEVLGQGAELAQDVLPLMSGSLGVLLSVTRALGPALPIVGAGLLGFKAASTASAWVGGLGNRLLEVSERGGFAASAAGRVGGALSTVGRVAPVVGIGVGLIGASFERSAEEMRQFGAAAEDAYTRVRMGGSEAVKAAEQIQVMERAAANVGDGFGTFGSAVSDRLADAKRAADESANSMSGLDRATQGVAAAEADLELAVGRFGDSSSQAKSAVMAYEAAQAQLARQQDAVKLATEGVTQAMLNQAGVARSIADSDYAYRSSVEGTRDALDAVTEAQRRQAEAAAAVSTAQREHGRSSEEAAAAQRDLATASETTSDAIFAVEGAALRQAEAARQLAFDNSRATSEAGKNAEADAAMLSELLALQATMGGSFPAALNATISRLQGSTNAGMVAAAQFQQLGLAVLAVPNSKTIIVSSTTPQQQAQLEKLGYTVRTLPDGRVEVTAATAAAEGAINYVARDRYTTIHATVSTQGGLPTYSTAQRNALYGASGGVVHAFAGGGFEPMQGGVAQVVRPNTWRVIGDRVRDDEAYIPINDSARSHQILQATMARMGYGREFSGSRSAGGGGGAPNITVQARVFVGDREITDIARVEASTVVASALTALTNQGRFN